MGSGQSSPPDYGPSTEIVTSNNPGKIILYEHPFRGGRSWTYTNMVNNVEVHDVASSIDVKSGFWLAYEHPDLKGRRALFHATGGPNQDGYYPDLQPMGFGDIISALQPVEPILIELFFDAYTTTTLGDIHDSSRDAIRNNNYEAGFVYGGAWRLRDEKTSNRYIEVYSKGPNYLWNFKSYFNDCISYIEYLGNDYLAVHRSDTDVTIITDNLIGTRTRIVSLVVKSQRKWVLRNTNTNISVVVHAKGGPSQNGNYALGGEEYAFVEIVQPGNSIITFYEHENFGGAATVVTSRELDLTNNWQKNNSFSAAIVHDGVWVGYDNVYSGQTMLFANNRGPKGDGTYPSMPGFNDKITSIKMLDFPTLDLVGKNAQQVFHTSSINNIGITDNFVSSLVVRKGHWFMYSETDYKGQVFYVHEKGGPGKDGCYSQADEWTAFNNQVGSALLVSWNFPLIVMFNDAKFSGPFREYTASRNVVFGKSCSSLVVVRGTWILYAGLNQTGKSWVVHEKGGKNGDGRYEWVEEWSGENDVIQSIELPEEKFFSVVAENSFIKLLHIDQGVQLDQYEIEPKNPHARAGYLSNGILSGEEVFLKKGASYLTYGSAQSGVKPSWNATKGDGYIIKTRDGAAICSRSVFTLSPVKNTNLYLTYTREENIVLKPIGSDPFEHDFRASNFVADALVDSIGTLIGVEQGNASAFDDGPVLREEMLVQIRYNKSFTSYYSVYSYIDGAGVVCTTKSKKRGQDADCTETFNLTGGINSVTVHYDSYRVTGITVNGTLLGVRSGLSTELKADAGCDITGFRGYQTTNSITKLGIIFRPRFSYGLLGRYFSGKACLGTMDIGVYALNASPAANYQSALFTGTVRSTVNSVGNITFTSAGTTRNKVLIDEVLVWENGRKIDNQVKTFNGSCHSVTIFVEYSQPGRYSTDLIIGGFSTKSENLYPGQTDRDYLRSYLNRMPPTNAFGRALMSVLYNNAITDKKTEQLRTLFRSKPKLFQILTASFVDTSNDAKSYMQDSVLAVIDDDLQKEAFGDVLLEKAHFIIADDNKLTQLQSDPQYKDLALAYLGLMAKNSDKNRFSMILEGKINEAVTKTWTSDWGKKELQNISKKMLAKYQPQLAFAEVTGEDISTYIGDIQTILETDSFLGALIQLPLDEQKAAIEAILGVLFALDPERPEKVEPIARKLLSVVNTTQIVTDPSIIDEILNSQKRPQFEEQLAQALEQGDEDVKEVVANVAKGIGFGAGLGSATNSAVAAYLVRNLILDKSGTSKVIDQVQKKVSEQISKAIEDKAENHRVLGKVGKFTAIFAGACSIIALALTAKFESGVDTASFTFDFIGAVKDGFEGGNAFMKVLGSISKTIEKVYNKILTPLKDIVAKAGTSIAAKATEISKNFGKLVNFLGSNVAKLVGPVLSVIGAGFSFYSAVEYFKNGDVANGVVTVIGGVVTTIAAVIGCINAITGALPVVNVVVAVISVVIAVFAFLFALFYQPPKKKNRLVAKLYEKGWASSLLYE